MLPEAEALSAQLRITAETGLTALRDLDSGTPTGDSDYAARLSLLANADTTHGALQLVVVEHVRRLVEAAHTRRW